MGPYILYQACLAWLSVSFVFYPFCVCLSPFQPLVFLHYTYRERGRVSERDRQTDRQTDRDKETEKDKKRDRDTDTDRQTDRDRFSFQALAN